MSSGRQKDGQGRTNDQITDPLRNPGGDAGRNGNSDSKGRKKSGATVDVKKTFKSKVSYGLLQTKC